MAVHRRGGHRVGGLLDARGAPPHRSSCLAHRAPLVDDRAVVLLRRGVVGRRRGHHQTSHLVRPRRALRDPRRRQGHRAADTRRRRLAAPPLVDRTARGVGPRILAPGSCRGRRHGRDDRRRDRAGPQRPTGPGGSPGPHAGARADRVPGTCCPYRVVMAGLVADRLALRSAPPSPSARMPLGSSASDAPTARGRLDGPQPGWGLACLAAATSGVRARTAASRCRGTLRSFSSGCSSSLCCHHRCPGRLGGQGVRPEGGRDDRDP